MFSHITHEWVKITLLRQLVVNAEQTHCGKSRETLGATVGISCLILQLGMSFGMTGALLSPQWITDDHNA